MGHAFWIILYILKIYCVRDCKVERREVTDSRKNCPQRIRYEVIVSFLYVSKSKKGAWLTNKPGRKYFVGVQEFYYLWTIEVLTYWNSYIICNVPRTAWRILWCTLPCMVNMIFHRPKVMVFLVGFMCGSRGDYPWTLYFTCSFLWCYFFVINCNNQLKWIRIL
jgi:hypothetical protein